MRVTYTPEDNAEGRRVWTFDPQRVRQSEAAIIERQYGKPYAQFVAEANGGMVRALRILVWHLMRTKDGHATLRFDDVPDFYVGEVEITHSAAELREGRANALRALTDPAERDQMLAIIDAQIAVAEHEEAMAASRDEVGDPGK